MSRTKIITILLILLAVVLFWMMVKNAVTGKSLMINPVGKQTTQVIPVNTPTPAPTPKTFKFDSSTDLKAELETINPQVLDSDFE